MRRGLIALLALGALSGGCVSEPAPGTNTPAATACTRLFGTPNAQTGLGPDQCAPECACGGTVWTPPRYDDAFVADLLRWRNTAPYAPLTADPYEGPEPPPERADTVCAVVRLADEDGAPRYRLADFDSEAAARAAGAVPTHTGRCGVCSTLDNLAVYIRQPDLAGPVRACGLRGIAEGEAANLACLRALGFDEPCAQVWYFNTLHTRRVCLSVCLRDLDQPYHLPDGGLNPCIQCDEDQSGAVFKAVAGRTRRNSGLPNALCRPCAEVRPLVHDYRSAAISPR